MEVALLGFKTISYHPPALVPDKFFWKVLIALVLIVLYVFQVYGWYVLFFVLFFRSL